MPKIYALSDTHGYVKEVTLPADADLILHAGDICPNFRGGMKEQRYLQQQWLEEIYTPWKGIAPIYATYGNHDYLEGPDNLNLDIYADYLMRINDLEVWFSPWSPLFGKGWAWMREDPMLTALYDAIPEGIDILVSHGPPYGYGDAVIGDYWHRPIDEDRQLGSKSLLNAINRTHPRVVLCGHIHTGHGVYTHTTPDGAIVTIYNVSLLDEGYKMTYPLTEILEWYP